MNLFFAQMLRINTEMTFNHKINKKFNKKHCYKYFFRENIQIWVFSIYIVIISHKILACSVIIYSNTNSVSGYFDLKVDFFLRVTFKIMEFISHIICKHSNWYILLKNIFGICAAISEFEGIKIWKILTFK